MSSSGGWVPPLPSRHAELLERLAVARSNSWASCALRAVLETVRDDPHGVLINLIAVVDAWADGDAAFCVIYTPPLGPELVGVRRQRGDREPDPWLLLNPENPRYPDFYDPVDGLAMPDAALDFGLKVADSISDSLGVFANHLRYDNYGLGWWGTLEDRLPTRPG